MSASVIKKMFCAVALLGVSSALANPTLTTLAAFSIPTGWSPAGGLIADAAGNLYGTTAFQYGTVFEITAGTNTLTTLFAFNAANGRSPQAGLIADAAGNLYGTTQLGGPGNYGTIFEIAAGTHTFSTVANFANTNGALPYGALITDAAGNLYGTTKGGGANFEGTVFEVPAGTHTISTLATFNNTNGEYPMAGLIADAAGNLYGTTANGGASGDGTVFEVAAGTHTLSTLATFNNTNGGFPLAGLIADAAGNLYGTTSGGNTVNNYGTVFELAAGTNTLSTLATFNGANGQFPGAGLIADAAGNLYGTTERGGANGYGTVFELSNSTDTLTTLVTFNKTNGAGPGAGLIADAAGNLYGTTTGGGANGLGTAFELTGAGFVVPEPTSLSLLSIGALSLLRRHRRI